jgi:hypothetical protein
MLGLGFQFHWLGPYQAWFPGIQLSRDFELENVPGTPTESPFFLFFLLGVEFIKKLFARVDSRIT